MYCISAPHSLLSLPGIFRTDLSHHRKSRGNRIPNIRTLTPPPLHGQRLLSPHIYLQHSKKNANNIHWQTSRLPAVWMTHIIWDYLRNKPPWPISQLLRFLEPSYPLPLRQTHWTRSRWLGLKSSDSRCNIRSHPVRLQYRISDHDTKTRQTSKKRGISRSNIWTEKYLWPL